ncbi:hypothetical protein Q9R46_16170 [Paenibacillus sp. RRE4]|uniref:Uncharacterized protein n=1 Tax=Paenibacillus silvae TaxID=1325358 RepID=A0ABQ1Z3F4_9BACL|nr:MULTISPECIES: hypothetical protein [Paenibacillus]MDT0124196.1 hypothetical protein [Paenibacillus sp. RRE4]GGH46467.1 hypothetical protein GCM10008014_09150 [Paenibacillus silvae]
MTLIIKSSTTTQVKGINTMTTIESAIATLEISSTAIVLIANMKAILTTPELITDFIQRVIDHPANNERYGNSSATNLVLYDIRKEQLALNSISDDSFLDMYLLNPLQALRVYFKESIVPHEVERMKQWGVNVNDLITAKKFDKNIRFERAVMQLV